MNEAFRRFADRVSQAAGSPWAFLLATLTVVVWFVYGLIVGFSDTVELRLPRKRALRSRMCSRLHARQ